jgi:putative Mg2+ transporter-C (MgtC) family protein
MEFYLEDIIRLLLAMTAGGLVGLEREFRDKSAGFRTLIFIAMGSAGFTILSSRLALDKDPTRIATNIVTGIGFLGAGAILRDGLRITGLTTAATIWLTAALGMAVGGGQYALAGILMSFTIIVLWLFPFIEAGIDKTREEHTYEVVCPVDTAKIGSIEKQMVALGLRVRSGQHAKKGEDMRCSWMVSGAPKKHALFLSFLFADKDIKEFRY